MQGALARRLVLPAVLSAAFVGGCQTYEPRPLDIEAHREAFDLRSVEIEPMLEFIDRLETAGVETPERFDWDDGLTLAEGEVVALFYNAELRLARLRAGVALATFETAGLWDDPVFGFDGAELLSPSGPFEYGLTLSLTIPISGRLAVEKDRAGVAYEAELRKLVHAEWATRAAVRRAWADWTVAAERVGLIEELLQGVDQIREVTARLETVGEVGRVDARLFRIEDAIRRTELTAAASDEVRARVELHGLLGLPADAGVELVPALSVPGLESGDDLDTRLVRGNTLLAMRRATYRFAEETLRLEVRKQYPDITIGAGYGNENDDRLLLGASMPIPILNANRQAIAQARAERDVSRAEAETAYERLSRELALVLNELDAATSQREAFETGVIPMADLQLDEVRDLAELGDFNSLLLLQSLDQQLRTKLRYLQLKTEESNAAIRMVELIGPDEAAIPVPTS